MSKKIQFMRDKDIDIVNENLENIIDKAKRKQQQLLEPTIDESKDIQATIVEYIKKNRRIVYGGTAFNTLLTKIDPKLAFYKKTDVNDIEFYSNDPINDIKNICDLLQKKKFKFIQGKSAQHEDTYTIFVNFQGYCDISYMPSNVYFTAMTENINGIRYIHPKFILVDLLRQFNDPIISFRRLDKQLKRAKLMIQNFPIEFSTTPITIEPIDNDAKSIIDYLLPHLAKMSTTFFIGDIAYNTFLREQSTLAHRSGSQNNKIISNNEILPIEIISTKLEHDCRIVYELIYKYFFENDTLALFTNKITVEQYHPFFQFLDKRAVYKYNGKPFLTIYGNNGKCIPYNHIDYKYDSKSYPINIGTFNVVFMILLSKYHQAVANKDKHNQNLYDYTMYNLLLSRNNYLDKHNKTILDDTIFEDFKIDCLGKPDDPSRNYRLSLMNPRLKSKSTIHIYDPDKENKDNFIPSDYVFENYSGNIINNQYYYIFQIKK